MTIPRQLELRILDVDADYVFIEVAAADGSFAGTASLYGGDRAMEELARGLAGFPRTPDDRRELELGSRYPRHGGDWVRVVALCVDRAGHVALEVGILAKGGAAGMADREARVHLRVEAAALDAFVQALADVPLQPGECVVLAATA